MIFGISNKYFEFQSYEKKRKKKTNILLMLVQQRSFNNYQ